MPYDWLLDRDLQMGVGMEQISVYDDLCNKTLKSLNLKLKVLPTPLIYSHSLKVVCNIS